MKMNKILLSIVAIASLVGSGSIFASPLSDLVYKETGEPAAANVKGAHQNVPGSWQQRCIRPVLITGEGGQVLSAICRISSDPTVPSKYTTTSVILEASMPSATQIGVGPHGKLLEWINFRGIDTPAPFMEKE